VVAGASVRAPIAASERARPGSYAARWPPPTAGVAAPARRDTARRKPAATRGERRPQDRTRDRLRPAAFRSAQLRGSAPLQKPSVAASAWTLSAAAPSLLWRESGSARKRARRLQSPLPSRVGGRLPGTARHWPTGPGLPPAAASNRACGSPAHGSPTSLTGWRTQALVSPSRSGDGRRAGSPSHG
jgi:hypothetical protein